MSRSQSLALGALLVVVGLLALPIFPGLYRSIADAVTTVAVSVGVGFGVGFGVPIMMFLMCGGIILIPILIVVLYLIRRRNRTV